MIVLLSLMNNSDVIRWSLDLRWQQADRDVGFYGLKHGVTLRSSTDPDLVIDWDSFNSVVRHDRHKQGPETTWQVRSCYVMVIRKWAARPILSIIHYGSRTGRGLLVVDSQVPVFPCLS